MLCNQLNYKANHKKREITNQYAIMLQKNKFFKENIIFLIKIVLLLKNHKI